MPSALPVCASTCDACLVRRLRAGDGAAFGLIHDRYRAQLVRHAERLLGTARASAEDVVQDALLRAHRTLLADGRDVELAPWLHTIVRNRAIDELRRERPRAIPMPSFDHPSPLLGPDAVVAQREDLRAIARDLARVPPRQRHALVTTAGGWTHADVARDLGVSEGTSKTLAQRGRLAVRAAARARAR